MSLERQWTCCKHWEA